MSTTEHVPKTNKQKRKPGSPEYLVYKNDNTMFYEMHTYTQKTIPVYNLYLLIVPQNSVIIYCTMYCIPH